MRSRGEDGSPTQREMVDFGKSDDEMIKISGKVDKSNTLD